MCSQPLAHRQDRLNRVLDLFGERYIGWEFSQKPQCEAGLWPYRTDFAGHGCSVWDAAAVGYLMTNSSETARPAELIEVGVLARYERPLPETSPAAAALPVTIRYYCKQLRTPTIAEETGAFHLSGSLDEPRYPDSQSNQGSLQAETQDNL